MKNQLTILLVLLIAVLAMIVAMANVPPVQQASGILHPEYKTMLKSGNSVVISTPVKWLAYLFGLGILGIFTWFVFIGARKKQPEKRKRINRTLGIFFLFYVIIFSLMVFSYWDYSVAEGNNYFWGFPIPTAWMMYPFWFSPIIITLVLIFRFDDYVINDEELAAFNALVKARKAKREN